MRRSNRPTGVVTATSIVAVALGGLALSPVVPTASAAGPGEPTTIAPGQTTRVVLSAIESISVGRGIGVGALRYVIRNTSAATTTNVESRFELPNGVAFVAAASSTGCRAPDTQVICEIASLGPGASVALRVGLRATDPSAAVGTRRSGTLLAPLADGDDEGGGELAEVGPAGSVVRESIPTAVSQAGVATWTWTTEIRPIFATARLCATGLNGSATLELGPGGPSATITGTGAGVVTSTALATPIGAVRPLRLSVTGTGWATLGLIGPDETCGPAAPGALGVNGRWRYRSPVELVIGSRATPRFEGAVWGRRDGRAISSARVANAGPDPVEAVIEMGQATIPPGATGCVMAAGSSTARCSVTIDADEATTVMLERRDITSIGGWTLRAPDNATPVDDRLPAG